MAYAVLDTKSAGNYVYAEEWRQIRDNWIAGVPDVFTAKGQIAVGTGADAFAALGYTSSHQVLTCASAETCGMKFEPMGVRLKRLAGTTVTVVAKDIAADENPSGIAYGLDRIYTCQRTGLYLMWLARGQSGTNYPYVYVIDDDNYILWGVTNGQKPSGARLIPLTAGDTFMFVYDNYIAADENYAEMCFVRLGVT